MTDTYRVLIDTADDGKRPVWQIHEPNLELEAALRLIQELEHHGYRTRLEQCSRTPTPTGDTHHVT